MDDTPRPPVSGDRPATPRWVKGLGIAIVLVVLLVVIVMVLSGGQHGPGMHTGKSQATGQPSSATGASAVGGGGAPAPADQASCDHPCSWRGVASPRPAGCNHLARRQARRRFARAAPSVRHPARLRPPRQGTSGDVRSDRGTSVGRRIALGRRSPPAEPRTLRPPSPAVPDPL